MVVRITINRQSNWLPQVRMWCLCARSLKYWKTLCASETLTNINFILSFFLLFSITTANDSVAMLKLATALSPTPKGWPTDNSSDYCLWPGIACDSSNLVTSINLCNKSLSGTLPSELSTLSKLQYLYLQLNNLTGPLPTLANLSELQAVYLGTNSFTSIPQGIFQGLVSLQFFSIGTNKNLASWSIPTDLNQCTSLIYFEAKYANIEGNIPDIFASLPSLQILILSANNLTGVLPPSFKNSIIRQLKLNYQKMGLSGNIDVLSSMTRLEKVWIHKNKFTGPIPDLSQCEYLLDLQLRDNHLTGVVPASLISLPHLQKISISNNKLQGPIPEFPNKTVDNKGKNCFCVHTARVHCDQQVTVMLEIAGALRYPEKLSDSWKGNDACKNWSSITCNAYNRIIKVNLGKQNFSGTISSAVTNLTALRNLYLNDNNLTGSIPDSLTKLPQLQVLDVSNNNLTGKVPAFASSVELITRPGNPLLVMDESPPGNPPIEGSNLSASRIVLPLMIIIFAVAIVIFIAFLLFNHNLKKNFEESEKVKDEEKWNVLDKNETSNKAVIPIEVLRKATDNFSENNILGKGGFGVVYKGELHDQTKIAVKRMETSATSARGMNEFQAEIEVLTKVRHRHLVDLLGYCISGNEGFLVYEYMPQGTLAQHLFEWNEHGYLPLTWKQRLSIALDVAHGVEYLHSLAQQSFIHRDLKPSNILLGDDMKAKVGDFGLVKNVPNGIFSLETRVAGTFGYLAPEYAATGRVTTKVDVYAFGVMLMETITGRKALDYTMEDQGWMFMHLVTWFRGFLINKKKIPKAIIDKTLNLDKDTLVSICKVAVLAGHCTNPESGQRPDIGHVVSFLASLVEDWKPSGQQQEQTSGIKLNILSSLPQLVSTCTTFNSFHSQSSGSPEFVTPKESPVIRS